MNLFILLRIDEILWILDIFWYVRYESHVIDIIFDGVIILIPIL